VHDYTRIYTYEAIEMTLDIVGFQLSFQTELVIGACSPRSGCFKLESKQLNAIRKFVYIRNKKELCVFVRHVDEAGARTHNL